MKFAPTRGVIIFLSGHRYWLATPGSVGQPRDGNPQAMYALLDTSRLQLAFQRVAYAHLGAGCA